jgi:4a-hydroxytetrahydrobiopterin dehydratase
MELKNLSTMHCARVNREESPLTEPEVRAYHAQISEWSIAIKDNIQRLERQFKFKNFSEALEFTNQVGAIAEEEDHHPLIHTEWGKVTVNWWTHVIKGLHQNDFIMAAKTDELSKRMT